MDLLSTPAAAKVHPSSVRGYALLGYALPIFLSFCWNQSASEDTKYDNTVCDESTSAYEDSPSAAHMLHRGRNNAA